jgi:hypothetical protein
MTLVLATADKIFADRCITSDSGEKCDTLRKVVANTEIIAGFAGDFQAILKAIALVESGESDPKLIAKVCAGDVDNSVEGIIVKDGRILLLDCKRVWKRPKNTAFYCAGTGASTAIAYLSGRLSVKPKSKLTDADIAATFRFVGSVRTDCSKKFDFVAGC